MLCRGSPEVHPESGDAEEVPLLRGQQLGTLQGFAPLPLLCLVKKLLLRALGQRKELSDHEPLQQGGAV